MPFKAGFRKVISKSQASKPIPKFFKKNKIQKAAIKKKAQSDSRMIIVNPGRNGYLAPEIAFFKMQCQLNWFIATGNQGVLVSTRANNLILPFVGTLPIGTVANTTITTGSGATATSQCPGYSNWFGSSSTTGIYTNWSVMSSTCEVECNPEALTDGVAVGVMLVNPAKAGEIPTTLANFQGGPYSKQKTFASSKGRQIMKIHVPMHRAFGMSKQTYGVLSQAYNVASELGGEFVGAFAAACGVGLEYYIIVQECTNSNIAVTLPMKTTMTYWVKAFNPRRANMSET